MSDSGDKKQLGKILLRRRPLTREELDALLAEQRAVPGSSLASIAARTGTIEEVDVLRALSEQHGVPGIDLSQLTIPTQNLKLVPYDVARQCLVLPFSVKDQEVFLAMADPQDRRLIDEVEFVTGRTVRPYVAPQEQLSRVIEEAYRALDRGEAHWVGADAPREQLASFATGASVRRSQPPAGPSRTRPPVVAPEELPPSALPPGVLPGRPTSAGTSPSPDARVPTLDPAFDARVGALLPDEHRPAGRTPGEPRKVLVVDDEDDIRRMLRRVLQERGFAVVEAVKGSEAIQLVREHVPDLILLDAMLPEIHGFDICRRIKRSRKYGHIPIVMVSAVYRGWRFAEDLRHSYGVDAFLEKPFKISDLVSAVERALSGRGEDDKPNEEELSSSASDALTAGIEAYKNGDIDGAIAHLREAVSIDPLAFRLHYHLGLLYGRKDDLFEAIHEMETAVDLAPRNFAALKNLAVLYQRAGFKHRAVEVWERALANAPDEETKRGIKEHLISLL